MNPVAFTIFGVDVRWYGLLIALGIICGIALACWNAPKRGFNRDDPFELILWMFPPAIIGARLYFLIFNGGPWDINAFAIWNGGISIQGAIIGGIVSGYYFLKSANLNFFRYADLFSFGLITGQIIGRWGNFTNQEAFGINTDLPWGMTSEKIDAYINAHYSDLASSGIVMESGSPVHPTFLYESIWCLLGFLVLYIVCKKFHKFDGQLILGYGIIYGLERAVVEGLRTDSLYIGTSNIRVSQLVSLALVVSCALLTIVKLIQVKQEKEAVVKAYKEKNNV